MVGDVGARVVLPQIKDVLKKKVITCLAAICSDRGNVDSIQVIRSKQMGHLW